MRAFRIFALIMVLLSVAFAVLSIYLNGYSSDRFSAVLGWLCASMMLSAIMSNEGDFE